jgi:uncharacterized protein (TIRG00374 family)
MRILRNLLPLIGVVLLVYIIGKIGIAKIFTSILEANYFLTIIAVLILIPMILMQTAKWDFILKKQGIRLSFSYLTKVQIISSFYESITPARVGSFIKIAYLQERLKNFGKSASSVVIDRALDFLSVAFLAFIGSLLLVADKSDLFYVPIIAFVLFLAGFLLLTNRKLSRIVWNIAYKIVIPKKFKEKANNSFNEFYNVLPNLKNILALSLLTLAFWLLVYTQAYVFALAFNVKIPYLEFICIFPISVIISLIPITISGFGTREAVLLTLFSKFDVAESGIITFSLVWAGLAVIIYSAAALYILAKKKV